MMPWKSICLILTSALALAAGSSAVAPGDASGRHPQLPFQASTSMPTNTPTRTGTTAPTPTVTATSSPWVYLPLVLKDYVAPEPPLPLDPPPPVGTVEAGGLAVIDVVNDTPYTLTLEFDGPGQNTTVLERCTVCRVYTFIGPIFCPTRDRPRTDIQVMPGTYWVRASVDAPDIRDFAGQWPLEGDTKYFLCFYILRTWGSNLMPHPIVMTVGWCAQ